MMNADKLAALRSDAAPYRAALVRLTEAGRLGTEAGRKVQASVDYFDRAIAEMDRSPGWVVRLHRLKQQKKAV